MVRGVAGSQHHMVYQHFALMGQVDPPGDDVRGLVLSDGSDGVPHSVWLRPKLGLRAGLVADGLLPVWALERACVEFAPDGGTAIVGFGPDPAYIGVVPGPGVFGPPWLTAAERVDLGVDVEPGSVRLAVVLAEPLPHEAAAEHYAARDFYRAVRRVLSSDGVLLVHTHAQRTAMGLNDPVGRIIKAAQAAGFIYLQQITLAHARPTVAQAPDDLSFADGGLHRRVHSDVLVFLPRV